jgi:hypothetical protein
MSQIGSIEFGEGSGDQAVPIFQPGDSETGVIEPWRIQIDNQTGFLPLAHFSNATHSQLRVQTERGLYALHDSPTLSDVPNSVQYQYNGTSFSTSVWEESIQGAAMSINGVNASTLNGDESASSDGTDDAGIADGPQLLPENNPAFGVAFIFQSSDKTNPSTVFGSASAFEIIDSAAFDSSNGQLALVLGDGSSNTIFVEMNVNVCDGVPHLICLNKQSDSGNDVQFYVDDMSSGAAVSKTVHRNQGFNSADYARSGLNKMGFFAQNNSSSFSRHKDLNAAFFEFNEEPYNATERQTLKQRAPGL